MSEQVTTYRWIPDGAWVQVSLSTLRFQRCQLLHGAHGALCEALAQFVARRPFDPRKVDFSGMTEGE